jgi:hypothetical protein
LVLPGDVFERETKQLGRFAFRDKHSTGEAAAKFVDEFVRQQHETSENLKQAGESGGLQFEKEGNSGGGGGMQMSLVTGSSQPAR